MKDCNTSEDFVKYAHAHGISKKSTKEFLSMLREFCSGSVASNKDFLIRWLVKFQIENTVTTLKPWRVFQKVKAYPAINILQLSKKK